MIVGYASANEDQAVRRTHECESIDWIGCETPFSSIKRLLRVLTRAVDDHGFSLGREQSLFY